MEKQQKQQEKPDPSAVQQTHGRYGCNLDLKNLQLSEVETNGQTSRAKK